MSRRVTVLVFAFNNAMEIRRCLDSIAAQTAAGEIHVVVHDDASSDETVKIAREFLSESSLSWEIITNANNQYRHGIDFFRQIMIAQETPFVALCDADDFWISNGKIEEQLRVMEADDELTLTHHSFRLVDSDTGSVLGLANQTDPNPSNSLTAFLQSNFVGACTVMYRSSAAQSVDNWEGFEALSVPDYPFWGMLSLQGRVGWINGLLSEYSVSNTGMSSNVRASSLDAAAYEVRRWLWYKFSSTGRIQPSELSEHWQLLIWDWQVLSGFRLPSTRYVLRRLSARVIGNLSFSQRWRLQSQLAKVRTCCLPRRRN